MLLLVRMSLFSTILAPGGNDVEVEDYYSLCITNIKGFRFCRDCTGPITELSNAIFDLCV